MRYAFSSLVICLLALVMFVETSFACINFSGTYKLKFDYPSDEGEISILTSTSKNGWTVFKITEHYQGSPLQKSSFAVKHGESEPGMPYCEGNKVFLPQAGDSNLISYGLSETGDLEIYVNDKFVRKGTKIADRTDADTDPSTSHPLRKFRKFSRTLPCAEANPQANPGNELQANWNNQLQPVFNFAAPGVQEPLPADPSQLLLPFNPVNISDLHLHKDQYPEATEQDPKPTQDLNPSQDPNPSHILVQSQPSQHPEKRRNRHGNAIGSTPNQVTLSADDLTREIKPMIGYTKFKKRNKKEEDIFRCDYPGCTRINNNHSNMMKHVNKHTNKDIHYCPYCRKGYAEPRGLYNHIERPCKAKDAPKTREAIDTVVRKIKENYGAFRTSPTQAAPENLNPNGN